LVTAAKGSAFLNAGALGKVILICKELDVGEGFNNSPFLNSTLLKSGLFSLVWAYLWILEEVAVGLYHG
jgi:hypothetical protein